jgi:hypothetical protein
MRLMEAAVAEAEYVPHVDEGDWSIDVRRFAERTWHDGRPQGAGARIAAVCLRLHQTPDRLEWLTAFPARGPQEWDLLDHTRAVRHLAVLGPAARPPRPQDLALVDYLVAQMQEAPA